MTEIRFGKCIECRTRAAVDTATHEIFADGRARSIATGEYVKCPNDRETIRFRATVKATTVPNKVCDAKCAMAVSETCKCSCGGSAHGRGAAAAHLRH